MQHEVDPNEYNQAHRDRDWVWKEYRNDMLKLNLLSSSVPYGLVDTDTVEELRAKLEEATEGQNTKVKNLQAQVEGLKRQQEELLVAMKKMVK